MSSILESTPIRKKSFPKADPKFWGSPFLYECLMFYKKPHMPPKEVTFRIYGAYILYFKKHDISTAKIALFYSDLILNFRRKLSEKVPIVATLTSLETRTEKKIKTFLPKDSSQMFIIFNFLKRKARLGNFLELFHVIKKIGVGSSAKVFLCECRIDNNNYAVKVMEKAKIIKENLLPGLENEISVLKSVSHMSLIHLDSFYETEEHYFLVFDLFKGGNLKSHLRRMGTLTETQASKVFRSILEGIIYLHEKNIMHRDIKPENILFRSKDSIDLVVLADFGLATSNSVKEYIYPRCGTPGYVPPEIYLVSGPQDHYGLKCDLFSLGVTIFEALTGTVPFFEPQMFSQKNFDLGAILKKNANYTTLSATAKDLLSKLICFEEERLNSKEALNHEFFKVKTSENLEEDDDIKEEGFSAVKKNIENLKKQSIHLEKKNMMILSPSHSPVHSPTSTKNRYEITFSFACNEPVFTGFTNTIRSIENSPKGNKGHSSEFKIEESESEKELIKIGKELKMFNDSFGFEL